MKVQYQGYLYSTWQDDDFVTLELQNVHTSPIKELRKLQYKNVRVTVEELPDSKISNILAMPIMVEKLPQMVAV